MLVQSKPSLDEIDQRAFHRSGFRMRTDATIADGLGSTAPISDDDPAFALDGRRHGDESDGGSVDAVFNVTLSSASGRLVTVDFATANGSATAPVADYAAYDRHAHVRKRGNTSQTFTVHGERRCAR